MERAIVRLKTIFMAVAVATMMLAANASRHSDSEAAVSTKPATSAAELMALALDHCLQADRSTCPEEQLELHRVADIYTVLATIDMSASTVVRETADAGGFPSNVVTAVRANR
jgi:hypothetical protein